MLLVGAAELDIGGARLKFWGEAVWSLSCLTRKMAGQVQCTFSLPGLNTLVTCGCGILNR